MTDLVCLPFAGGNRASFAFLRQHLPPEVKVSCLEYPGHGGRMGSPPLQDLDAIASDAFAQLGTRPEGDYFLFGHSLGACVAFLLAERIARSPLPPPRHIFLSGQGALTERQDGRRHLLPRREFLELLAQLQGTPPEVLACRELVDFLEPVLRADFAALDAYPRTNFAPIPYPVTVLHGSADPCVPRRSIEAWRDLCSGPFSSREFSGGHFFIHEYAADIAAMIATLAVSQAFSHAC